MSDNEQQSIEGEASAGHGTASTTPAGQGSVPPELKRGNYPPNNTPSSLPRLISRTKQENFLLFYGRAGQLGDPLPPKTPSD